MKTKTAFKLIFFACMAALTHTAAAQQKRYIPDALSCEHYTNPLGVDIQTPALSWVIKSLSPAARGMHQTAYQLLVAASEKNLKAGKGDVWNTGKIASDQMNQIAYSGKPLVSGRKYWWKVRIWDEKGQASNWSAPAFWVMGILTDKEWGADWISAAGAEKYAHEYKSAKTDFNLKRDLPEYRANKPALTDLNFSSMLVRKSFPVKPALTRAVINISGLGQYELSVNGKKVGDQILSPGWSDYRKTVLYDTYDITSQLKSGANSIGIMLSNGMYNITPDY
jgi:alpha-L-rhamnosidase